MPGLCKFSVGHIADYHNPVCCGNGRIHRISLFSCICLRAPALSFRLTKCQSVLLFSQNSRHRSCLLLRLAISLLIVDLFSFRNDNAIHEFWGIFLSLYQPHLSADPVLFNPLICVLPAKILSNSLLFRYIFVILQAKSLMSQCVFDYRKHL